MNERLLCSSEHRVFIIAYPSGLASTSFFAIIFTHLDRPLIASNHSTWPMFINGAEESSLPSPTRSCLLASKMRRSQTSQAALARLARRCDPRSAPTFTPGPSVPPPLMVNHPSGLPISALLSRKPSPRPTKLGLKDVSLIQTKSWTR